jgi:hypothetical protein
VFGRRNYQEAIFVCSLFGAATANLLVFSSPAQARYIVTLEQHGHSVVATGTGAIDLTGLTLGGLGAVGVFQRIDVDYPDRWPLSRIRDFLGKARRSSCSNNPT